MNFNFSFQTPIGMTILQARVSYVTGTHFHRIIVSTWHLPRVLKLIGDWIWLQYWRNYGNSSDLLLTTVQDGSAPPRLLLFLPTKKKKQKYSDRQYRSSLPKVSSTLLQHSKFWWKMRQLTLDIQFLINICPKLSPFSCLLSKLLALRKKMRRIVCFANL